MLDSPSNKAASETTTSPHDPDQPQLVRRISLRNFKSIQNCTVDLQPLTLIVGRNAVGKSNFLDALRFVSEALGSTLEFALRSHGGIDQVRRRSLGSRPPNFHIKLDLNLPDGSRAEYGFAIRAVEGKRFSVSNEKCIVTPRSGRESSFAVRDGKAEWSFPGTPPANSDDRLFLIAGSGIEPFRAVYDCLVRMAFLNLNPDQMKRPQRPEAGGSLARDGHNIASVIKELQGQSDGKFERVLDYIRAVGVPITSIAHRSVSNYETIEFRQSASSPAQNEKTWSFDASSMSDGTIRALGILISVLASGTVESKTPSLVGVEEPETALHPAAAGALFEALREGSRKKQVLVTCHSPDLLDHPDLSPESILAVVMEEGKTKLGPLSEGRKKLLSDHLHTAGELLRLDQLTPDPQSLKDQDDPQLRIKFFDEAAGA